MMKTISFLLVSGALTFGSFAASANIPESDEINDSNTPLHLLKPDYVTPYGELNPDSVRKDIDRVFAYIDRVTPAKVVDKKGNTITNLKKLPEDAMLNQGTYRLTSYEWAVMYMALLDAAKILDDSRYSDYVFDRIAFLGNVAPAFEDLARRTGKYDGQMRSLLAPATLDDSGAISGAFMKAMMENNSLPVKEIIERYYNVVNTKTLRLPDGTVARNRPHHNSVWLDDMFMALPTMATRTAYTSDPSYLEDAAETAVKFIDKMWIPEKGLFRHGYVDGLDAEPEMAWGRANGWAILTMCQLLDVIPESNPNRAKILDTYRKHVKTLAGLQNKDGFWHQLLDRPDSYPETSATAIFAYSLAHGINQGWINPTVYGPVAQLAWEAVASKINGKGEVEDVCVGTGMGFDPAYYYYRPVSVKAAHGYGPTIWAGAEIIKMLRTFYPKVNDSAVHFYRVDPEAKYPIFMLDENGKAIEIEH